MRAYPGLWLPTWKKWQNPSSSSHLQSSTLNMRMIFSHWGKRKALAKKKRQNKNVVLCIQWTDVYKRLSELSNAPYYNVRNAGWVRNINLLRFPACIHANEWLPKSEYWPLCVSCLPSFSHKQTVQLGAAHLALTSARARNPPSFYPAPFFPRGSSAQQGHVLLCILARSVTKTATTDWHALACNL